MKYLECGAVVSADGRYRYRLHRKFDAFEFGLAAFVLLNPSTASASEDDPTVRRCLGFAKIMGCSELVVVNLFALRATNPKALYAADEAVGPENDSYLRKAFREARQVFVGWGAHGSFLDRGKAVTEMLGDREVHYVGTCAGGNPIHPLYSPYSALLTAPANNLGRPAAPR